MGWWIAGRVVGRRVKAEPEISQLVIDYPHPIGF